MHLIGKPLLSFVVIASALAPSIVAKSVQDGGRPVIFAISPSTAHPGDTILCTVTLDNTVSSDSDVAISPFSASKFSSVPTLVTVPSGDDHVSFYATLSTTASGSVWLSASANGGTVLSPVESITP